MGSLAGMTIRVFRRLCSASLAAAVGVSCLAAFRLTEPFESWAQRHPVTITINEGESFHLPRGHYSVRLPGDLSGTVRFEYPGMSDPAVLSREGGSFHLPVPSSRTRLVAPDRQSLNTPLELTFIGAAPFPVKWLKWFPPTPDARFHEIPVESLGFLYRLDTNTFPVEPDGFWVKGNRTARFSILNNREIGMLEVRMRSLVDTGVEIRQGNRKIPFELKAGRADFVQFHPRPLIPGSPPFLYDFTITCTKGVRPADMDPSSRDRRYLGVFLELVRPNAYPDSEN